MEHTKNEITNALYKAVRMLDTWQGHHGYEAYLATALAIDLLENEMGEVEEEMTQLRELLG